VQRIKIKNKFRGKCMFDLGSLSALMQSKFFKGKKVNGVPMWKINNIHLDSYPTIF